MIADIAPWRPSAHCQIHAISRPIHDRLAQTTREDRPLSARVLARFRRAVNLNLTEDGTAPWTTVALITPELPMGPFHVMVDLLPEIPSDRTYQVSWDPATLRIGPWELQASQQTVIWEPRPRWDEICVQGRQWEHLRGAVDAIHAAQPKPPARMTISKRLPAKLREGVVSAVVSGDSDATRCYAAELAGYGPGLTPSGDDFLAGVMLALWATQHPQRQNLCDAILEAVHGRTTQLSMAFLEAAHRGEADARWQSLLYALAQDNETSASSISRQVTSIGTFGATSGLDMLAGFVEAARDVIALT